MRKYFWWFVSIHCTLWVIMPTLMRYALPHDTIEGAMWGQHLEWGYDKNPWMNAWLTRLGWDIGGQSGIGIYVLSSFFVGLCFWSVWKLAQKFVTPAQALLSVLVLEGCINYTLVPQEFNDNAIELGLWPLLFLLFYKALQNQKIRYWLGVGVVAGLAMMAKYYTGIPLLIMLGYLIFDKHSRISFSKPGLYYGLLAFIIVILPNLIWLFQHHFITIDYAFGRADAVSNFWKLHAYYPLSFGFSQIAGFIIPILFIIYLSRKYSAAPKFIVWMALGPFLLTILLGMVFGWHLYNEWGVPLVSLWGLLLICCFKPEFKMKKILMIIYIMMALWAIGYAGGLMLQKSRKHSDNYPAQQIANYVTHAWTQKYHTPLKYVAGSRYVGGYVAFYSKDHPSVFVEWNPDYSQWINIKKMKQYGAIFVQDNYYGTLVFGKDPDTDNGLKFPSAVLKKYPNLIIMPVKYFNWYRSTNVAPIPVLIGFLPPKGEK